MVSCFRCFDSILTAHSSRSATPYCVTATLGDIEGYTDYLCAVTSLSLFRVYIAPIVTSSNLFGLNSSSHVSSRVSDNYIMFTSSASARSISNSPSSSSRASSTVTSTTVFLPSISATPVPAGMGFQTSVSIWAVVVASFVVILTLV